MRSTAVCTGTVSSCRRPSGANACQNRFWNPCAAGLNIDSITSCCKLENRLRFLNQQFVWCSLFATILWNQTCPAAHWLYVEGGMACYRNQGELQSLPSHYHPLRTGWTCSSPAQEGNAGLGAWWRKGIHRCSLPLLMSQWPCDTVWMLCVCRPMWHRKSLSYALQCSQAFLHRPRVQLSRGRRLWTRWCVIFSLTLHCLASLLKEQGARPDE